MPRSSKNIDEPARPVISDPHDILMNAPIGVFTSTPEGSLIYANHALADMYGYADPQDLVTSVQNIGAELFADPKDPPVVNRLLANEGTVRNYECEHIRMDGSRFWASENIRTVYAEDGSISHYQGFVTDITERKAADNQWQDTFDSVPDMIALIDTSHRILRDKAESRLDQEEFLMDDLSSHEIKALIHDLRVHQIELEMQNEELRYAQKQLEFTRDQFARLYNDAPLGYLTIDENSIIVRTNQTFAVMLGLEPHQIIGASLAEYVVPEDKGAFYGRFHAFFRHPDGKHLDFRIKGVSGELVVRCFGRLENEFEVHSGGKASKTMLVAV
ncbi:MAG: PAS domain S-box protein, partial [Desulfonatronovibrio sp. MSAO_Bac4]